MKKKSSLVLLVLLLFPIIMNAYADDSILISISTNLDKVVFDGKWTDPYEWKQSSYDQFIFDDGSSMHVRTAHQGDFIYIQINFQSDVYLDKGSDHAIVCFDTKNDKSVIPQNDDFCFSTFLDEKKSLTYQGNNNTSLNEPFNIISNHKNFIGIGTASDKFDRYSQIPHASYEFRIPLEILNRSDNYGFFILVFDGHSQNYYSWPNNIEKTNSLSLSNPSQWGNLISPDKSLPEFDFLILFMILIPSSLLFLIMTKLKSFNTTIFKN